MDKELAKIREKFGEDKALDGKRHFVRGDELRKVRPTLACIHHRLRSTQIRMEAAVYLHARL